MGRPGAGCHERPRSRVFWWRIQTYFPNQSTSLTFINFVFGCCDHHVHQALVQHSTNSSNIKFYAGIARHQPPTASITCEETARKKAAITGSRGARRIGLFGAAAGLT